MQDPRDNSEKRRFPVLLRSAWFGLNKSFRRRLVKHGLTPAQFIALRWLSESPSIGLSQTELAKLTSSNANNVADLVARMERDGLISRSVGKEDARIKNLFLTPAGVKAYEAARDTAVGLQTEVLSELDDSEREEFLELLERVAVALDRMAVNSPPPTI